jgi:hypothetical protein
LSLHTVEIDTTAFEGAIAAPLLEVPKSKLKIQQLLLGKNQM